MQDLDSKFSIQYRQSIAVALVATVMLVFVSGCRKVEPDRIASVDSRVTPTIKTYDASSLISDSGVTRYRFEAKEWLMYTKADNPYWYFPKGVYVEKFDSAFKAESTVEADTAYFFEREKLWKLIGNVKMLSTQNERFETQLLFWDQTKQRIYSDSTIRIEQPERVIVGRGFESNETMTKYTLRDTEGIFNVKDEEPVPADTIASNQVTLQP
ncbi:MAG: LPS export ABC transporter periplasmic protein LptC [Bacteroidales bacterium]